MTNDALSGESTNDGMHIHVERDAYVAEVMHIHPPPPDPPPTPRELPPDVFGFTGRTRELDELDLLLTSARDQVASAVVISAVSGTAGVGKTALAIHWAHKVREHFPDGDLYFDLRGFDPDQPTQPSEVLAAFLRSLGLSGNKIPDGLDERVARFRSLLHDRRMLVILDNAHDVEQVRQLLPGTPLCFVIVTSRDDLAGLTIRNGARHLDLDLLSPADATRLLRTLVGPRIDAEPEAAALLAEYCVRLPLALRIAAQLAASRPTIALSRLASELADEQRRLERFGAGGDPRTAVDAVFSWSYRYLSDPEAQAFRLLGLHPGRGFDAYAVAALMHADTEHGQQLIDALAQAHLIQAIGAHRYNMHDLLRVYARRLMNEHDPRDVRSAAFQQLSDYYVHSAAAAVGSIFPHEQHRMPQLAPATTPVPDFADATSARVWLDTERPNLVAISRYSDEYGWPAQEEGLASVLRRYLESGSHFTEALTVHGNALRCARENDDKAAEARELNCVAIIKLRQGLLHEARDYYIKALELLESTEDRATEGAVLSNLGNVEMRLGNVAAAVAHHERSLAIRREVADRIGEGHTLNNLGFDFERLGRYDDALAHLEQSLVIFRELHDTTDEAITLGNIGTVYRKLGRYEEARSHFSDALEISRQTGDRASEGDILKDLGLLLQATGDRGDAVRCLRDALFVSQEIGDKNLEVESNNALGDVLKDEQPEMALTHFQAAAVIAADVGARYEEARASTGKGYILRKTGLIPQARDHWLQALEIYRDLEAPEIAQITSLLRELEDEE